MNIIPMLEKIIVKRGRSDEFLEEKMNFWRMFENSMFLVQLGIYFFSKVREVFFWIF